MKNIKTFEYCFHHSAYAGGTAFFVKDDQFIENLDEIFKAFSLFLGLTSNLI